MRPETVWILGVHISGLVLWCAALLYLPALIVAGAGRQPDPVGGRCAAPINRMFFTAVATPAALFAIVTGSLLLPSERLPGVWLILKLTAVTGMIACHVLYGMLILRSENDCHAPVARTCLLLAMLSVGLIGTVLWLVLAKPY
jgi:uncharacterized membrane protein